MEAANAFYEKSYQNAIVYYSEALELSKELNLDIVNKSLLTYMLCLSYTKSNDLEDLAEAVYLLRIIEKRIANKIPAIYCVLAESHYKLYQ